MTEDAEVTTAQPVSETRLRVRYAETDAQGVVYYANYLVWFEVGRVEYLRQRGLSYAELERQGEGIMIVEASCRYHASAVFDDEIVMRTWCDEVKRSSFRFRYQVLRAGDATLLAEGYTVQVYMDMPAKRPMRIPPAVRRLIEPAEQTAPL